MAEAFYGMICLFLPQFTLYGDVLCYAMFICCGFYFLFELRLGFLRYSFLLRSFWGISLSAESDLRAPRP
jgi:hypothetical protein